MREIGVYVWWSAGRGDGDGYDETIKVTDEQYDILKELDVDGEELNDIDDPRIKDQCKIWYDELTEALYEASMEYFEEDVYRDDCLIDPDDEEYDPNGEEEQFSMTRDEWWNEQYTVGVSIAHDFYEDDDE